MDSGFGRAIAVAEGYSALKAKGSIKLLAQDWRKDWHGKGKHSVEQALSAFPFCYPRDVAIFNQRELYALAEENRPGGWGLHERVTRDVYRHPEYRDAIRDYNPRTVFDTRS